MSRRKETFLAAIILAFGIVSFILLALRRENVRTREPLSEVVVEVVKVKNEEHPLSYRFRGEVISKKKVSIFPKISGEVVRVYDAFVEGSKVAANEPLLKIEDADYLLRVKEAEAALEIAKVRFERAKLYKENKELEWKVVGKEPPNPAAVGDLEFREAQANMHLARARIETARLALSRTVLRAPFDSIISKIFVSKGDIVGPQRAVAVVYDPTSLYVKSSVPYKVYSLIKDGETKATFYLNDDKWECSYYSFEAELEPAAKRVIIYLKITPSENTPLLGSFGDLELSVGKVFGVAINDSILKSGKVYVVQNSTLKEVTVEILARVENRVIVSGLSDGSYLVVSPFPLHAIGRKVKWVEKKKD